MSLSIDAIDHIALNVADLEVSGAWYVRVLGMERIAFESHTGIRVALRFGKQKINLRPADADTVTFFTGVAQVPGSADLGAEFLIRLETWVLSLATDVRAGFIRAALLAVRDHWG